MSITDHGIHILPDESAAGTWHAAFDVDERLVMLQDDLTCGPLRGFESLSNWTALPLLTPGPESLFPVTHQKYKQDTTSRVLQRALGPATGTQTFLSETETASTHGPKGLVNVLNSRGYPNRVITMRGLHAHQRAS